MGSRSLGVENFLELNGTPFEQTLNPFTQGPVVLEENYLPLEKGVTLYLYNFESSLLFCARFG